MDLRAQWEQLAPRERVLVGVAAVLVPVAAFVMLVARPLVSSTRKAAVEVSDRRALLRQVEQVAARLGPQSPANAGLGDAQSLVVVVDRTTRAHNLGPYVRRDDPDGKSGIRVRLENVPFDALVEWLADVQNTQGLAVTAVTVDPVAEAGRVNCTAQLTRGAAK
jgi:general secretion pathway protein M